MVADINELFSQVQNLWSDKKKTIIFGRVKEKADAMIEQLEQDLEEIKRTVVKSIQVSILRGIDVTNEIDSKLESFKKSLDSQTENENKNQRFKRLFKELLELEQECKSFDSEPSLSRVIYDRSDIKRKVIQSITIHDDQSKEEKKLEVKNISEPAKKVLDLSKVGEQSSTVEEVKEKSEIEVAEFHNPSKWKNKKKFLLTKSGIFYIERQQYLVHREEFHNFQQFGAYQVGSRLYLCGGFNKVTGYSRELNCKNEEGDVFYCNKMTFARSKLGLGGAGHYLAAIGGRNQVNILKFYQRYLIHKDIWVQDEPLFKYRERPGVCCYENYSIYAFGGFIHSEYQGHSVEKKTRDSSWISMDIDFGKPIHNVACVPYQENILVFGGYSNYYNQLSTVMGLFDAQREQFEVIHHVGKIPIHMSSGSFIKNGNQIYAVMYRKKFEKVWHFDGKSWEIYYDG